MSLAAFTFVEYSWVIKSRASSMAEFNSSVTITKSNLQRVIERVKDVQYSVKKACFLFHGSFLSIFLCAAGRFIVSFLLIADNRVILRNGNYRFVRLLLDRIHANNKFRRHLETAGLSAR